MFEQSWSFDDMVLISKFLASAPPLHSWVRILRGSMTKKFNRIIEYFGNTSQPALTLPVEGMTAELKFDGNGRQRHQRGHAAADQNLIVNRKHA